MGQLKLEDVRPGMVLAAPVMSSDGRTLLLKEGHTLTIKGIQKIKELKIETIEIADRNSLFVTPIDKMAENLERDFLLYLRKISPKQAEANKNDNMVRVADELEQSIGKICHQEKIMEFCVQLKLVDNLRLYQHSVNTAVLAGLTAGAMGMTGEQLTTIIAGGLLHDIGLCEIHQEICELILYHHERLDGSGFPKIKAGDEIPICAQIIGLCSRYDEEITVQHVPPYMAIEEIYGISGLHFSSKVVEAFVNNIPVYPLGVMVRLSNKEVGIVANIRKNQGPRPIVKVFFNRMNRPITETKIVDLSKERTLFIEEILE